MKSINLHLIFGALVALIACNKVNQKNVSGDRTVVSILNNPNVKGKSFFTDEVVCKIRIPNELRINGYDIHSVQNGFVYLFNRELASIKKINLKTEEIQEVANFAALNLSDETYPIITNDDQVLLISNNKVYRLGAGNKNADFALSLFIDNHLYSIDVNYFYKPIFDPASNSIFVPLYLDDDPFPENYRDFPCVGKIDLTSQKLELVNIKYPARYKAIVNYGLLDAPLLSLVGRNLSVMFGLSKTVSIHNIPQKSVSQVNLNSKVELSNPESIDNPKTPQQLTKNYFASTCITSVVGSQNHLLALVRGGFFNGRIIEDASENTLLVVQDLNGQLIYEGGLNNLKGYKDIQLLSASNNEVTFVCYIEEANKGYEDIITLKVNAKYLNSPQ